MAFESLTPNTHLLTTRAAVAVVLSRQARLPDEPARLPGARRAPPGAAARAARAPRVRLSRALLRRAKWLCRVLLLVSLVRSMIALPGAVARGLVCSSSLTCRGSGRGGAARHDEGLHMSHTETHNVWFFAAALPAFFEVPAARDGPRAPRGGAQAVPAVPRPAAMGQHLFDGYTWLRRQPILTPRVTLSPPQVPRARPPAAARADGREADGAAVPRLPPGAAALALALALAVSVPEGVPRRGSRFLVVVVAGGA